MPPKVVAAFETETTRPGFYRLGQIGRLLIVAIAIVASAVAIVACVWRPDRLAALTLVPAWCWLLVGILSAILVWRVGKTFLSVALASFWLVFAGLWVEELPALVRLGLSSTAATSGTVIQVVSLNCANSEKCLADLQALRPEVVLLQEAPSREALSRMTSGLFGEQGGFVTTGDVAILANGKIGEPIGERGGDYICANVRLHSGCVVQFVSLRLASPPPRFDPWNWQFWMEHRHLRETHRRQLGQIKQVLRNDNGRATVLGGDFNTTPLDAALSQLRPTFADTFPRWGVGWGATGTNDWPLFRVDQIWTNSNCQPMQVSAIKTAHSDHRLVVCVLEVRK